MSLHLLFYAFVVLGVSNTVGLGLDSGVGFGTSSGAYWGVNLGVGDLSRYFIGHFLFLMLLRNVD